MVIRKAAAMAFPSLRKRSTTPAYFLQPCSTAGYSAAARRIRSLVSAKRTQAQPMRLASCGQPINSSSAPTKATFSPSPSQHQVMQGASAFMIAAGRSSSTAVLMTISTAL